MSISLAIPTYNSAQYLWDCIRIAINDSFFKEIIIYDDHSNHTEFGNICKIVNSVNSDKIKILRGNKNQGAYFSKYNAVLNCSSDWIYLLDSDNWFDVEILSIIKSLDLNKTNICYIPEKLLMTNGEVMHYNYKDAIFDIDLIKKYIVDGEWYLDWFLNSGNFIVNKKSYLKSQKKFFEENLPYGTADVIIFSYYWLISGMKYKIVKDWYYHHRLHTNNYFMKNGMENLNIINKFLIKMAHT
jgi:glycosyltransferase involved in cell wall biosynthesis